MSLAVTSALILSTGVQPPWALCLSVAAAVVGRARILLRCNEKLGKRSKNNEAPKAFRYFQRPEGAREGGVSLGVTMPCRMPTQAALLVAAICHAFEDINMLKQRCGVCFFVLEPKNSSESPQILLTLCDLLAV